MQDGDPVVRGVFHCQKWKTTVVFVIGKGNIGKSNISFRLFDSKDVIALDPLFYGRFENEDYIDPTPEKIEARFRDCYLEHNGNIQETWEILKDDDEAWVYFTRILLKAIRLQRGREFVIVEGSNLDSMIPVVKVVLENEGFMIWVMRKE
jgi:hypothetical protein